jgi:hypothetical protein
MSSPWYFQPLLLLLMTSSAQAGAQQRPDFNPAALAKKATPAVVFIKGITLEGKEVGGSGFIVDAAGTIVTNLHVIQNLKTAAIRLSSGEIYDQIKVRAFDERKDLAIIQIPGFDLPALELGNSNTLQPGDSVVLIGNPFGLEASISAGIVSGIRKTEDGFQVFQTDAAANPGNSGGPMLNTAGAVVGILTYKLRGAENLNFVVPINYARGLLSSQDSLSLNDLREKLGKTADVFNAKTSSFPQRWKSLASGTTKILRFEGEHLYVETVLPDELKKLNNFTISDLVKTGDKYIGTTKSRITCRYTDLFQTQYFYNTCNEERAFEITMLTATRIEGWYMGYPDDDKPDCKKCKHSKPPIKQSFVWIPE